MKKNNIKQKKKNVNLLTMILIILVLILVIGFSAKNRIYGYVINQYQTNFFEKGIVEIDRSKLNTCINFEEEGEEKTCAVLPRYSCSYCEEYLGSN